jgi:hypothetical protein
MHLCVGHVLIMKVGRRIEQCFRILVLTHQDGCMGYDLYMLKFDTFAQMVPVRTYSQGPPRFRSCALIPGMEPAGSNAYQSQSDDLGGWEDYSLYGKNFS